MATAKSTPTAEISEIQRRMAQIRHELHIEVREAVKGAQSLTDWRSLVRNHPWATLSAMAVAGYLIVPRRRVEAPTIVAVSPAASVEGTAESTASTTPTQRNRWGILSTAFSLLAPIAVRAVQNYASQSLEQWLAQQPADGSSPRPGAGPSPRSSVGPERPRVAR